MWGVEMKKFQIILLVGLVSLMVIVAGCGLTPGESLAGNARSTGKARDTVAQSNEKIVSSPQREVVGSCFYDSDCTSSQYCQGAKNTANPAYSKKGSCVKKECPGGVVCDGSSAQGILNEVVCGTDLKNWKCTTEGWSGPGEKCVCRSVKTKMSPCYKDFDHSTTKYTCENGNIAVNTSVDPCTQKLIITKSNCPDGPMCSSVCFVPKKVGEICQVDAECPDNTKCADVGNIVCYYTSSGECNSVKCTKNCMKPKKCLGLEGFACKSSEDCKFFDFTGIKDNTYTAGSACLDGTCTKCTYTKTVDCVTEGDVAYLVNTESSNCYEPEIKKYDCNKYGCQNGKCCDIYFAPKCQDDAILLNQTTNSCTGKLEELVATINCAAQGKVCKDPSINGKGSWCEVPDN